MILGDLVLIFDRWFVFIVKERDLHKRSIKIGDKVQAIDEDFEGFVVAMSEQMVDVESDDGFVIRFRESELIPAISSQDAAQLSQVSSQAIALKQDLKPKKRQPILTPNKKNKIPPMEVDLHIGKLVNSNRGMSNFDILNLQLDTAKRQLAFARGKRIQRIVFIHGVGEGILKEELHYLLRKEENLDFYDADYQKYGAGATEVYLFQKGL